MKRLRRGVPPLNWNDIIAGKLIRCAYCYGTIGFDRHGRRCLMCAGTGYIYRHLAPTPANGGS